MFDSTMADYRPIFEPVIGPVARCAGATGGRARAPPPYRAKEVPTMLTCRKSGRSGGTSLSKVLSNRNIIAIMALSGLENNARDKTPKGTLRNCA